MLKWSFFRHSSEVEYPLLNNGDRMWCDIKAVTTEEIQEDHKIAMFYKTVIRVWIYLG